MKAKKRNTDDGQAVKDKSSNSQTISNEQKLSAKSTSDGSLKAKTTDKYSSYVAAVPAVAKLFNSQKNGLKGLHQTNLKHLKRNKSIVPTTSDYIFFQQLLSKVSSQCHSSSSMSNGNATKHDEVHTINMASLLAKKDILKHYETQYFISWLWLLQLNNNLLFYGVGSKLKLMRLFVKKCLDGEDVLLISGRNVLDSNHTGGGNSSRGSSRNTSKINDSGNDSTALANTVGGSDQTANESRVTSSRTNGHKIIKSLLDTIAKTILKHHDIATISTSIGNSNNSSGVIGGGSNNQVFSNLFVYARYLIDLVDIHYGRGSEYKNKFKFTSNVATTTTAANETTASVDLYNNLSSSSSSSRNISTSSSRKNNNNGDEGIDTDSDEDVDAATINTDHTTGSFADSNSHDNSNRSNHSRSTACPAKSLLRIHSKRHHKELNDQGKLIEMDAEWGRRYAHAQTRLYIVIDSIDGALLCGNQSNNNTHANEVMLILSLLASCPSISLIASCDTVNAPLLWSPAELVRFKWSFIHAPTYEPFVMEYNIPKKEVTAEGAKSSSMPASLDAIQEGLEGYCDTDDDTRRAFNHSHTHTLAVGESNQQPSTAGGGGISVAAFSSLSHILKALSTNHREVLAMIVKTCITASTTATAAAGALNVKRPRRSNNTNKNNVFNSDSDAFVTAHNEGDINFEKLYELLRPQLTVSTRQGLEKIIKEFADQKVLSMYMDDSNKRRVKSIIPMHVLASHLSLKL